MPTQKTSDWGERFDKVFPVILGESYPLEANGLYEAIENMSFSLKSFIESLLEEQREEIRREVEKTNLRKYKGEDRVKEAMWNTAIEHCAILIDDILSLPCLQTKEK